MDSPVDGLPDPDESEYLDEDISNLEGAPADEAMLEHSMSADGENRELTSESNGSAHEEAKHGKPKNGQNKPNLKDPTRPRRKKARRACFACQRAHLTCGDERPCQRCIKRGLQDQCADGVRKKAKYLHDTPAEALLPPGAGRYRHSNGNKASISSTLTDQIPPDSLVQASGYYTAGKENIGLYQSNSQQDMPPPVQPTPGSNSFTSATRPLSPNFNQGGRQTTQQTQSLGTSLPQTSSSMPQFGGPLFDPSDPALFNFDIASLNFGNHYGALEFGMLDQMSSGVYRGQNDDQLSGIGPLQDAFSQQYPESSAVLFSQDALINADWPGHRARQRSTGSILQTPNNTPVGLFTDRDGNSMPQGFAIGAGPGSLASASPVSQVHEAPTVSDNPSSPALFVNTHQQQTNQPSPTLIKPLSHQQPVQPPQMPVDISVPKSGTSLNPGRKRPYDADIIYESVTQPYSYTNGFHRLLHFIKKRFSSEKRIRIAKALAAVRPSLITFSQQLTHRDLVFMEVSVQRKLCEYVHFINAYGTPTIITRRDGAVIAASKEFMILTGWNKNVLLGKEPNLNTNTGGASNATTAPGSGVQSAERTRQASADIERYDISRDGNTAASAPTSPGSPQAVLIAELLDQDSIVEFYEDYAKLAFGDSAGHAIRRGKLVKYRPREDVASQATTGADNVDPRSGAPRDGESRTKSDHHGKLDSTVSNEAAINKLGEEEGLVDCMIIWNVRRDIFEVPMLIVMNFLPVI